MMLIDLTGNKFDRWTVIERSYPNGKSREPRWLCKCECGIEKIIYGASLRNGKSKSCGCLHIENMKIRMLGNHLNRLPPGIANIHQIINSYKCKARKQGIGYKLTTKQFTEITQQNCYYCGAKPSNIAKTKYDTGDYIYNGIDRVDNAKGYTVDNIVPCCKVCNYAKKAKTLEEFKDWIEKVYHKINEKDDELLGRLLYYPGD